MEAKKTLIVRIWQILRRHSDPAHKLTHQQIIDLLESTYGIECERKAVGRNLALLNDMGLGVVADRGGAYIAERTFGDDELRLLIDSVLCSRHISAKYSNDLIDRLIDLGTPGFKCSLSGIYSVKDQAKTENKEFFLNIELLAEAISSKRKVRFEYNRLGFDKKLKSDGEHTASPYHMFLHNQHYYVMLRDDKYGKVSYYRIDKMTGVQVLDLKAVPLKENEGFENNRIDYRKLATALPYMYSDLPRTITLKCANNMTDHLYDWFGDNFNVIRRGEDDFTATVYASEQAMLFWVLQYNTNVEVLLPASLRQAVKDKISEMAKLYAD